MAEETGTQTAIETTTPDTGTSTTTAETQTVGNDAPAADSPVNSQTPSGAEQVAQTTTATGSFSKDDLDWAGYETLTDEQKSDLVKNYSNWFKDKDSANAYLRATAEANKNYKEAQAKKVADLEAGWEKSLKTDAEFGKDYEGNKKKVLDYATGHLSESDMAEFKKFGFDKSPVLNRMILGFVKEIEDAKIVGKGQPAPASDKQPRDRWGNTMFDFTKKQQ